MTVIWSLLKHTRTPARSVNLSNHQFLCFRRENELNLTSYYPVPDAYRRPIMESLSFCHLFTSNILSILPFISAFVATSFPISSMPSVYRPFLNPADRFYLSFIIQPTRPYHHMGVHPPFPLVFLIRFI